MGLNLEGYQYDARLPVVFGGIQCSGVFTFLYSLYLPNRPPLSLLEMLLGMLKFLLFHESTGVKKGVSLMEGWENGKHGGYGNEGSFCVMHLFCSGITQNVSFFCFFEG